MLQQPLKTVIRFISIVLISLMFLKSILDLDTSWDTLWYHLPFAARLSGLITSDSYSFENWIESVFNGFPCLAELLQGLLWSFF